MKPTYTRAEVYTINAKCETPLRTGGNGDSLEIVLYREDGRAIIQGTSIAGALRAWCARSESRETENLFGNQNRAGHLIISEGIFDPDAEMQQRPRVSIDGANGVANQGGKYDVAHIASGSEFQFTITWLGDDECVNEIKTVENMLSALNNGEIQFGAYKTNGFGRVSIKAYRQSYDLKNKNDLKEWLDESKEKVHIKLTENKESSYVRFIVEGSVDSLLVKSAYHEIIKDDDGSEKTVTVNINENGKMILPASSLKGAVKSRAEAIADYMHIGDGIKDRAFGNSERSGSVYFEDVILNLPESCRPRIRINYFTGGVIGRALFNENVLSGNLEICLKVKKDAAVCALVLLALRDLGLGMYSIGSGMSVGRGFINVKSIKVENVDNKNASLQFDEQKKMSVKDSGNVFKGWLEALRGYIDADTDEC